MSALVLAAIDQHIAETVREVEPPVEPFGYGADLSCTWDLDERMTEVDPFSVRAVQEAIFRRLTTPRGSLPDDDDYGIDVREFLGRGTSEAEARAVAGRLHNEILKDDRVQDAEVAVSFTNVGKSMSVSIRVTPEDPSLGEFEMTLAVTSAEVALEAMAA